MRLFASHLQCCTAVVLHAVTASALVARPKLIVFDLDNTLWTPELYKLRRLPNYASAGPPGPMADQDVRLYAGARAALEELATDEAWKDTSLACASRTNKGPWARQLLRDFTVAGRSLDDLLQYKEIFTGDKIAHFNNLQQKSEIAFDEMLFFDDARDGKYGNCAKVAAMGVCSAHYPDGITTEVWTNALAEFSRLKAAGAAMGTVVDAPGRVPEALPEGLVAASIKMFRDEKNFGFVRVDGVKGDVFFHGSSVASNVALAPGMKVKVRIGVDNRGRRQCDSVEAVDGGGDTLDEVERPIFSMNMPFAGLVAHGVKTLETRNHTMFVPYEGQEVLLHVGRRTYPDGGIHREILARDGRDESEIDRVTSLPAGFSRGQAVAVVRVGKTELISDERDRCAPDVEAGACATGQAMGRYVTTITDARWLGRGVPMRGQPGVFAARVPRSVL
jgi:magnesium-dependent phosphatase 1